LSNIKLPEKVKRQAEKALQLLVANFSHPSLRTKKMKSRENIWEARVAEDYRFSFEIRGDTYVLRRIGKMNPRSKGRTDENKN